MTSTDYLHFAESFFKDCVELSRKKTADYTGNGADAFANFRQIPENWTEIGFLTRMGDKMARLRSFVQNGDLQVKDESATDTLRDLANYCSLFAAYLQSDENSQKVKGGKPLTVKVVRTKSDYPDRWYKDVIGQNFEVVNYTNETYRVVLNKKKTSYLLDKDDCEIVSNPATNH